MDPENLNYKTVKDLGSKCQEKEKNMFVTKHVMLKYIQIADMHPEPINSGCISLFSFEKYWLQNLSLKNYSVQLTSLYPPIMILDGQDFL